MREGKKDDAANDAAYALRLPENPSEAVGRTGYEVEDRDLAALLEDEALREQRAEF